MFYVGPSKEKFIIPIKILRRFPFYASNYQEFAVNTETKLPKVNSTGFRSLENYLYDNDFDEGLYGTDSKPIWKGLRNMYLLGADWELVGLQKLVVKKLKRLHALLVASPQMPTCLLEAAERIYRLVPESDYIFGSYFVKTLQGLYQDHVEFPQELEKKLVMNGGLLAGDILDARRAAMDDLTAQLAINTRTTPSVLEPIPESPPIHHHRHDDYHHHGHHHHDHHGHAHHHQPSSHDNHSKQGSPSHSGNAQLIHVT